MIYPEAKSIPNWLENIAHTCQTILNLSIANTTEYRASTIFLKLISNNLCKSASFKAISILP